MTVLKTIGGAAATCRTCRWTQMDGYCGNGDSIYFDKCASDNVIPNPCPDYEPETAIQQKQTTVVSLAENVQQLGAYLSQMAQMLQMMQKRMDEFEAAQKKVTLTHQDVKDLHVLIRLRAMEYCEKYQITDPACLRKVSAAMKKAVLTRYGVKDLHDVPAIARSAVEAQICHFTDIRLVMKCREMIASGSG